MWPDLAKFHHFGQYIKIFGNKFKLYLVLGNVSNSLWHNLGAIGQIFIDENGQILKNNSVIWSHCSYDTNKTIFPAVRDRSIASQNVFYKMPPFKFWIFCLFVQSLKTSERISFERIRVEIFQWTTTKTSSSSSSTTTTTTTTTSTTTMPTIENNEIAIFLSNVRRRLKK